ncbi:unnamed protein product [Kuraishia capsulata CBS 1993]|uniref:MATE efflux family protein n=1 Tax=Kuraishia capsulata CBS 1993 TaxID=1382522 RepID=W6MIV9_9ASCO|nr:uncharacterized protein KUCA_T00000287001 [Kuraishia capsulata CBS 1993]CDK24327.1 unnamed protein product [Kuraishia capsulata CBS 1993]
MSIPQRQFSYTNSERRASVVVGSVGRAGLFIPSDFISPTGPIGNDDDEFEQYQSISDELDPEQGIESYHPQEIQRKASRQLLSEEAELLAASRLPIRRYSSSGPDPVTTGTSPLVKSDPDAIVESWEDAMAHGGIKTTPKLELKVLTKSSIPLVITFVLQNSMSVASVFSVGHIGATELAAVTLGSMTANITGYALIQGLATSLDTFLPQAYGAKKYKLVGLVLQRCTALIMVCMLVICLSWWLFAEQVLVSMLPDPVSARLAAQYLRLVSYGIPGYVLFETGKRFLQAQGIFHASSYVLFVCAPLNAIMNYVFVWNSVVGLGFIGAPISVSINYWLMALGLFLYTVTSKSEINPMRCWNGFQFVKAFKNWGELMSLALPSVIMIEAEFLAFEILTLMASYLGTTALAAQSVIATMSSLTYQVPFGISIACSTRIANFLGARLPESAKICTQVSLAFGLVISFLNCAFFLIGKQSIASWFTSDPDVIAEVAKVLPLIAFIQIWDALNAVTAGCLRGQGMQKIGGIVNMVAYYVVGIPLAIPLAFYTPLRLFGLWIGTGLGLLIIGIVQGYYCLKADYQELVNQAIERSSHE